MAPPPSHQDIPSEARMPGMPCLISGAVPRKDDNETAFLDV